MKLNKKLILVAVILVPVILIIIVTQYVISKKAATQNALESNNEKEISLDKNYVSKEDYDKLSQEYCSTELSQQEIDSNHASHFGLIHYDPENSKEITENAGIHWERTLSMMLDLSGSDPRKESTPLNIDDLFREFDMYVMNAQLNGVWFMQEIFINRPPDNNTYLEENLTKFVERYDKDGKDDMPCLKYPINYFAIGNEVEVTGFFDGTEEDYFNVLKKSYIAIKKANPDAKIVQAGMVSTNNPSWDKLFEMGAADYFDIANIHEVASKESIMKIYDFQEYLTSKGVTKPMWITEIQFEQIYENPSLTQKEYAEIMTKYTAYSLAHNFDKLFIVNTSYPQPFDPGQPPFTAASALIANGNKTPIFDAVKTTTGKLDYFESVTILKEEIFEGSEDDGSWNVKVLQGQYKFIIDGTPVYVLWGTGNLPAEIKGTVLLTDIYGESRETDASTIILTDSPVFIENIEKAI